LKTLHIAFGLSLFLLLFGCLNTEVTPAPEGVPELTPPANCHIVTLTEPYTEEVCWNVTYTQEVCEYKALEFSVSSVHKLDLCTVDGDCVGKELSACPHTCTGAMKRCRMNVTNLNPDKAGVWAVGANFTLDNAGFIKDPVDSYLQPGETWTFDFTQLYTIGLGGSSMDCDMYLVSTPTVEFCHQVGKDDVECQERTLYRTIEREVCE